MKNKVEIVDLDTSGDLDTGGEPVTVGDMKKEKDEPALTKAEEKKRLAIIGKEQIEELDALYDRVLSMQIAMRSGAFKDSYFKPIDGNITELRTQLETEEKPREVTFTQGKLSAYKNMRDFPMTCVDLFNDKLKSIKKTIPLFVKDDNFIQKVKVTYDKAKHEIVITTPIK